MKQMTLGIHWSFNLLNVNMKLVTIYKTLKMVLSRSDSIIVSNSMWRQLGTRQPSTKFIYLAIA